MRWYFFVGIGSVEVLVASIIGIFLLMFGIIAIIFILGFMWSLRKVNSNFNLVK
ncbi:MAG: hypothetical protein QXH10_09080 [Ignisphaera sp.]